MGTALLNRGTIRGEFARILDANPLNSLVESLALVNPSSVATETFGFAHRVAKAKEWAGSRRPKFLSVNQISITNKEWDTAVEIPIRDWRRDQTGQLKTKLGELADEMAALKWRRILDYISAGGAATLGTSYDGQFFFDSDHAVGGSGSQTNLVTATEIPALNIADGTTYVPTAEEAVDIIMAVIGYFNTYKDDEGVPMMRSARKFVFLLPSNMWAAFYTAITANNLSGGESNVVRGMVGSGYMIEAHQESELFAGTGASFYAFIADRRGLKPFLITEEVAPTVKILGEGSEWAEEHKSVLLMGDWTGGHGYGEPLTAMKCTVS